LPKLGVGFIGAGMAGIGSKLRQRPKHKGMAQNIAVGQRDGLAVVVSKLAAQIAHGQ
jgi:hypothetical protein